MGVGFVGFTLPDRVRSAVAVVAARIARISDDDLNDR